MELYRVKKNGIEIFIYTDFNCGFGYSGIEEMIDEIGDISEKPNFEKLKTELNTAGYYILNPEEIDLDAIISKKFLSR